MPNGWQVKCDAWIQIGSSADPDWIQKKKGKKMEKACLNCGKLFIPAKVRPDQKYCCFECGTVYRRNHKKNDEEKLKDGFREVVCRECGKTFLAKRKSTGICAACYGRSYRRREKLGTMKIRTAGMIEATKTPIKDFEAEAREKGLSYGELQALKRLRGERV